MQLRAITDTDFEQISEWFVNQPWNLPPVKNGMSKWGFVVSDDTSDIFCCYVYMTETGYAFADWFGMNPKRDFNDHKEAAKYLLSRIEGLLKGYNSTPRIACLAFYTKINWLADVMKQSEWKVSKNFTQVVKVMKYED